jgi:ADP-heptose:LPS heptosyltransferase
MSRRIGIFRIGSLGDHLIALPLYRRLRDMHRDDSLLLFSNLQEPGNVKKVGPASLFPASLFDAIHDYPVGSDWHSVAAKLRLFRAAGLERLYYLMPTRSATQLWRDKLFFGVARVPVIGLGGGRGAQNPRYVAADKLYEHEADRLARAIGIPNGDLQKSPERRSLQLTAAERAEALSMLGGAADCTVTLSIGTKCDVKDWGLDNWAALVSRLAAVSQIDRLLVIGSADEFAASETLRGHWPRHFQNFCGRLAARQSAAVLGESQLFVGHDSGPMHMAAAVDVPVVAIFSSRALPGVWFPLTERRHVHYTYIECMGCGRSNCEDRRKKCIRSITVEQVFDSCLAALARSAPLAETAPMLM